MLGLTSLAGLCGLYLTMAGLCAWRFAGGLWDDVLGRVPGGQWLCEHPAQTAAAGVALLLGAALLRVVSRPA